MTSKIKLSLTAVFALAALPLAADKITIKNTFGADLDESGDYDFYTRSKTENTGGTTDTDSSFALADEFQVELKVSDIEARFRLDALYSGADDAASKLIIAPHGFVHYKPVDQFGIIAGNDFFKHLAIPSAYLAAADTTTKWGRLVTDSLGHDAYFGSEDVSVYSNGFAGAVTSDWTLGTFQDFYLKLAAGATMYPGEEFEKAVDAGINAGMFNLFDIGATAHNLTEDDRKFGGFIGLTAIPELIFNAQFYYNFTDSDFLPQTRVERNNAWEYKKQKTKYAAGASAGYYFDSILLGLYADFITGLTNEYIDEVKYYDASGNLICSKVTTIVRGETVVKYKNGKAKRTDEFTARTIPMYAAFRANYLITADLEFDFSFKLRSMLYDFMGDSTIMAFAPKLTFELPENYGKIGAGVRLTLNKARADGLTSISVPVSYTYKFKKKF
jgi:hypothetical protein